MLSTKKLLYKMLSTSSTTVSGTHLFATETVYKRNGIVQLYIAALKDITQATEVTLFTLPAGYRPVKKFEWDCVIPASSGQVIRITINTNGVVTAYNYSSPSSGALNIRASCMFMCV